MRDILKLGRIELIIIVLFVVGKAIRPTVLTSDAPNFIKLVLLSLPNFFEGIIGVCTLTMLGLVINQKWLASRFKGSAIYMAATLGAAVFVITQEVKIHNLGGNNVYDPMDVVFSIIGLAVGFWIVYKIRPKFYPTSSL